MRTTVLLIAVLSLLGACHGSLSWVPDPSGQLVAIHKAQVKLPGLEYLALGARQHEALEALRGHGFDCSDEASTSRTQACVRAPGTEEPTGGVVMLEFDQAVLSGVQAQLQPPDDGSGGGTRQRFERLAADWNRSYGRPQEVKRPGVIAVRHSLPDGTALFLVRYEGDATLIAEHLQVQTDSTTRIPAPPRDTGTR